MRRLYGEEGKVRAMLLVMDINNTHIKVGIYQGTDLLVNWRISTDPDKTADEFAMLLRSFFEYAGFTFSQIDDIAISCVVPPLMDTMDRLCENYFGLTPLQVGPGIRTGMRILYEDPKAVGADRIVGAIAAYEKYGGPAIVVDFGTATTFTAVSKEGDFLGGAIAPGIGISMEALAEHAAQLRRVELVKPRTCITRNTVTAMQAGVIYGFAGLVEEIVRRMKRELAGEATVIATGGWAELVIGECRSIDHHDPLLNLEGLRIVYERNREAAPLRASTLRAQPEGPR